MFGYYVGLGLRSLRRNLVLTTLIICVIAVGIAAFTATLTVVRAMANDPIADKSSQLFAVQIDNWGPEKTSANPSHGDLLESQLSYTDATALMDARQGLRQAAMYVTSLPLTPPNPQLKPFTVQVRATYADFFAMFDVPLKYGSAWSAADDQERASVVVIASELNEKLFGGANSVGMSVNLDGREYRIVGVMNPFRPIPRFYDLNIGKYSKAEEVFLPFTHAVERHMETLGNDNCTSNPEPGWDGHLRSECVWIQFWTELPTAADVSRYRSFLNSYAADQQRSGRFQWPPRTQLRDVRQWLSYEGAVSDEARVMFLVSVSFLFVCLLNAMGLMLARIMGRARDIGVRRALGASRDAILAQCLVETGVVGLAGGLLGLALTAVGLRGMRSILSEQLMELTRLDFADVGVAVLVATVATIAAGVYPTWRASHIQPAWQLKAR